jgi:hypothetical protein
MSFDKTFRSNTFTVLTSFLTSAVPLNTEDTNDFKHWYPSQVCKLSKTLSSCFQLRCLSSKIYQTVQHTYGPFIKQYLMAKHRITCTKYVFLQVHLTDAILSTVLNVLVSEMSSTFVHLDSLSGVAMQKYWEKGEYQDLNCNQAFIVNVKRTYETDIDMSNGVLCEANWVEIELINPNTNERICIPQEFTKCGSLRLEKYGKDYFLFVFVLESFEQEELLFPVMSIETKKDFVAWNCSKQKDDNRSYSESSCNIESRNVSNMNNSYTNFLNILNSSGFKCSKNRRPAAKLSRKEIISLRNSSP